MPWPPPSPCTAPCPESATRLAATKIEERHLAQLNTAHVHRQAASRGFAKDRRTGALARRRTRRATTAHLRLSQQAACRGVDDCTLNARNRLAHVQGASRPHLRLGHARNALRTCSAAPRTERLARQLRMRFASPRTEQLAPRSRSFRCATDRNASRQLRTRCALRHAGNALHVVCARTPLRHAHNASSVGCALAPLRHARNASTAHSLRFATHGTPRDSTLTSGCEPFAKPECATTGRIGTNTDAFATMQLRKPRVRVSSAPPPTKTAQGLFPQTPRPL